MATGYRLKHLPSMTTLASPFISATGAALSLLDLVPRSAGDYITVPIVLPCECGVDYVTLTACCVRPIRGALGATAICPECRSDAEVYHQCPKCRAELDPAAE